MYSGAAIWNPPIHVKNATSINTSLYLDWKRFRIHVLVCVYISVSYKLLQLIYLHIKFITYYILLVIYILARPPHV